MKNRNRNLLKYMVAFLFTNLILNAATRTYYLFTPVMMPLSKQYSKTDHFVNNSSTFAAIASPTSLVDDEPPISRVRTPVSVTSRTASSISSASLGRASEYRSSSAMERMAATGLTMPFPAISGADPIEEIH
jgi:hypothetical protein